MKKTLIILLVVSISIGSLFAAEHAAPIDPTQNEMYSAVLASFRPTSTRALGMGDAALAVSGRSDSFFYNPAALAEGRFQLSLPAASVTLYHPADILEKGIADKLIQGIKENDNSKITGAAADYLGLIKSGKGKLATVDAAMSFTAGGFGLGVFVQDNVHTYAPSNSTGGLDSNLIDELNVAARLGLGFRINLPASFSIDLGVAASFNYLAFSQKVNANDVMTALNDGDVVSYLREQIPIMAGWAVPIDAGVNINMPFGFTVSAVARNFNGKYSMVAYDNANQLIPNIMKAPGGAAKYTFNTDWQLDAGLGWKLKNVFFQPTIAVDVTDIIGLAKTKNVTVNDFMYHLNAGAEIRLLSFLDVRGGLNKGYWSVGAGIDLWAIKIDVAYSWMEFGAKTGDNPGDALSIRFNIGYDR